MTIQEVLNAKPSLAERLFCRGYLITDRGDMDLSKFPFYGNWRQMRIGNYYFYTHKFQHIYSSICEDKAVVIIGNAVNPFSMEWREQKLADELLQSIQAREEALVDAVNQWTGAYLAIYLNRDVFYFISDPTEMLFCSYGKIGGHCYLSSHPQLIADIESVQKSSYIKKLEQYRFFYKYGVFFPGDITQYEQICRAMTNHLYSYRGDFSYKRIFPTAPLQPCQTEKEYHELIHAVGKILQNTMKCAAQKWKRAAISMTGGMDSKTTLAMANGMYDSFYYYSYDSMDGDTRDAEAAHTIAKHIGIPHDIHDISRNDQDFEDIEAVRAILEHNNGGYRVNANDVRKRAYFSKCSLFDVEIKSWVSEVARANYYKKFGLKKMPAKLSPRNMTAMYKIFLTERRLAKQTDSVFQDFIRKSGFNLIPAGYDPSDMYLWEVRYSSWGGTPSLPSIRILTKFLFPTTIECF